VHRCTAQGIAGEADWQQVQYLLGFQLSHHIRSAQDGFGVLPNQPAVCVRPNKHLYFLPRSLRRACQYSSTNQKQQEFDTVQSEHLGDVSGYLGGAEEYHRYQGVAPQLEVFKNPRGMQWHAIIDEPH